MRTPARFLLIATLLVAGCQAAPANQPGKPVGAASAKPDPVYTLAGKAIKQAAFLKALQGSLVFVGQMRQRGEETSGLLTALFAGLVLNGIDFGEIAQYKPAWEKGVYTFTKGGTGMSFKLAYAKDFGENKAGDLVPHNLFDPGSYVVNPRLEGFAPTYDPGPLSGLVNGDVTLGLDLKPKVKLDTSYLAFELASQRDYPGKPPRTKDFITFKMASTRTGIETFNDQLAAGGFGVRFDQTAYASQLFGIQQTFVEFPLLIKQDKDGAYFEGTYTGKAEKEDLTFYLKGAMNARGADQGVQYFEDEKLSKRIGVLAINKDGKGAGFAFDGSYAPLAMTLEEF